MFLFCFEGYKLLIDNKTELQLHHIAIISAFTPVHTHENNCIYFEHVVMVTTIVVYEIRGDRRGILNSPSHSPQVLAT